MSTTTDTKWLTVRDLCARFQLSRAAVYALIARGALPRPIKFGRAARFDAALVSAAEQRLVAAQRGGGEA